MKNIIAVQTAKSLDEACAAIEKAVAAHHFGILHVHNVRQTLADKGVALDREVRIFDVCNPQRAKQVLEANPLAATALPCAIAVFAEREKTTLAFIRPTAMLGLVNSEDLRPVAEGVERTVQEIVETAAR